MTKAAYAIWFWVALFLLATCAPAERRSRSAPDATSPARLSPGDYTMSMDVGDVVRTWILHVPPAALRGDPLPLLVVLHGGGGTGRKMQQLLGFDAYADARGFYVAYPDAFQPSGIRGGAHWNDGRGTAGMVQRGSDDVAFIKDMILDIGRRVPLDASRVYVTGASNGGMMTCRLGCETGGVFAGIAPVIANMPAPVFATCAPHAPLTLLAINGDADPLVPLAGGNVCQDVRFGCEGGQVVSHTESVKTFAIANACDPVPQVETLPQQIDDGTLVERRTFLNCAGGATVVGYIVRGGGHTWPPLPAQLAASGAQSRNLDATRTIVDAFFPE
ncbi:alpha/beta hydrolase family esterase [Roseiflexus castenholzii]|uniref:alpha/beta hydrolase family esterase n=1 Tax=Roseiflexus castenholzii TaxID=120962 RepID=UPI003C7CE2A8